MPNAFQFDALQADAFQIVIPLDVADYLLDSPAFAAPDIKQVLVADDYDLGSLNFAAPDIKQVLVADDYWLGGPDFAEPTLSVSSAVVLDAADYYLGRPVFVTPGIGQVDDYILGHPVFDRPALGQLHVLTVDNYDLDSPIFGSPRLSRKLDDYYLGSPIFDAPALAQLHVLTADDYYVGAPVFATPGLGHRADDFYLGSPLFGQANLWLSEDYFLGAPSFAAPVLAVQGDIVVADYFLGRPIFGRANLWVSKDYFLGSPIFARPFLGQQDIFIGDYFLRRPRFAWPILYIRPAPPPPVPVPVLPPPGLWSGTRDVRIVDSQVLLYTIADWLLLPNGLLDESEVLANVAKVALMTDRLSDLQEVRPDPDSTDRRGWWGDLEALAIWNGWPIGCKNWLLERTKMNDAKAWEGATVVRAENYTREALRPMIDLRLASKIDVKATRIGRDRIDVRVVIYRGPMPEIALDFQDLWQALYWGGGSS